MTKSRPAIVLGGGHGTFALRLLPNSKVYLGSWDDGGSTGLLRVLFPDILPVGDLKSLIIAHLKERGDYELADLLSVRSPNIRSMLGVYQKMTHILGSNGLHIGFEQFLEDYFEKKLHYLNKHHVTEIPEDNFGNILFLYRVLLKGWDGLKDWIHSVLRIEIDFDFSYDTPVFLYGYYFDSQKGRLRVVDGESSIDTWHSPVLDFSVRNSSGEKIQVSPNLLKDCSASESVYLAPGSAENYLPVFTDELCLMLNNHAIRVNLVAPLFLSQKDQELDQLVASLSSRVNNLHIFLPSLESFAKIVKDERMLLSYAVQRKTVSIASLMPYRNILKEKLLQWKKKSHSNELFALLYEIYSSILPKKLTIPFSMHLDIELARDGWKHKAESFLKNT